MQPNNILIRRLFEYARNHAPEQTLICVEYGDTVEYCYLVDCMINENSIVWRYISDNSIIVLVPLTVSGKIL